MSDTYTGECKVCGLETDLINGICANCFEEVQMILPLKKQVCALEYAIRLRELGCPQDSIYLLENKLMEAKRK